MQIVMIFLLIANIVSNLSEGYDRSCKEPNTPSTYLTHTICKKLRCDVNKPVHRSTSNYISVIALLLAGDIQVHPGPRPETIYPCGYCESPVTWDHQRAVCCDDCSIWYHSECIELSSSKIDLLCHSSTSWICCKCDTQNVDNFTYHSYELDISNQFQVLSNVSSIPSIDSSFSPTTHSSPKPRLPIFSTDSTCSHHPSYTKRTNKHNLRVLIVNCQSIRNKRSAISESVEYTKPDVIVGCESWLGPEHKNSEIFPDGYQSNVYRKDRNKNGGGVFIAVHDNLTTSEVEGSQSQCEAVWTELHTNEKSVLIGSYYRPPNSTVDSIEELSASIHQITRNKDKHVILAGDFNLPHINWEHCSITPGAPQSAHHQGLLSLINEHGLEQMQKQPTRINNVLDLYLTNHPSLVKSSDTIPGVSDHHMVIVDSDLKPKYNRPKRRKVYKYNKANWSDVKTSVKDLSDSIISHTEDDVDTKWTNLKKGLVKIMDDCIPSRMTSNKHNLPWINDRLRREIKRKHRLFQKAKKDNTQEAWDRYKQQKRTTQKDIRQAHWNHVNNRIEKQLDEGNSKPFWKYIKAKRHLCIISNVTIP